MTDGLEIHGGPAAAKPGNGHDAAIVAEEGLPAGPTVPSQTRHDPASRAEESGPAGPAGPSQTGHDATVVTEDSEPAEPTVPSQTKHDATVVTEESEPAGPTAPSQTKDDAAALAVGSEPAGPTVPSQTKHDAASLAEDSGPAGPTIPSQTKHDATVVTEANEARPARVAGAPYDPATIDAVRVLVETTTLPHGVIGKRYGVPARTVSYWQQKFGWPRPEGAPQRLTISQTADGIRVDATVDPMARARRLTLRLYRVFARQVGGLETRIANGEDGAAEKDARALATLARTLQTLMALDRDDGAPPTDPEAVDRDALNADLAQRIARWAEGGEGPE